LHAEWALHIQHGRVVLAVQHKHEERWDFARSRMESDVNRSDAIEVHHASTDSIGQKYHMNSGHLVLY
jgi:ABC-type xylose transport system substrate-binding protein